uniref:Uncharacterized protein n=1 Tax=Oryza rufipogon TaxID=4529 RepID=A0A0E0MU36_ORYRU
MRSPAPASPAAPFCQLRPIFFFNPQATDGLRAAQVMQPKWCGPNSRSSSTVPNDIDRHGSRARGYLGVTAWARGSQE